MFASLVASIVGVSDPGMADGVKAAVAAAGALVVASYQVQHHKTIRHADTLAAQLHTHTATLAAHASAARVTDDAPDPTPPHVQAGAALINALAAPGPKPVMATPPPPTLNGGPYPLSTFTQ